MFRLEALAPIAIAFGMVLLACKIFIPRLAAPLRRRQDCLNLAGLQAVYFWRVEAGNYQSNAFKTTNLTEQFRGTAYGTVRLSWQIWEGKRLELTPEGAYRYSPVPVVPGLRFDLVPYASLASYADGDNQNLLGISGGPSLTLGHFNRPFWTSPACLFMEAQRQKLVIVRSHLMSLWMWAHWV